MKRKKKNKRLISCFTFTPETIQLTEEAIKLFEQPLQQADHREPKVLFAEGIIEQVKNKLDSMKKAVGLMGLTSFDYNEKIIVIYALRLYSLCLSSSSANAQQAEQVRQCLRIAAFFEADNARGRSEYGGT